MKSYEQIAQAAYAAYLKHAQRIDTEGLSSHALTWDQLDEGTRQCWVEAIKQAAAELALVH